MSDKKNIDRLFQEKFKDFEAEPNEQIWLNIDAALREKKKRRVIPFWFKATGIAAGLLLGFFVWNSAFDDIRLIEEQQVVIGNEPQLKERGSSVASESESVTDTENSNTNNSKEKTIIPSSIKEKASNEDSVIEDNDALVNQSKTEQQSTKSNPVNSGIVSEKNNAVANSSTQTGKASVQKKTKNTLHSLASQNQHDAVAHTASKSINNKKASTKTNSKKKHAIVNSEEEHTIANVDKNDVNKNASDRNTIQDNGLEDKISNDRKTNSPFATNQKQAEEKNTIIKNDFKKEEATGLIKDSTALAVVKPNALEELLKKSEEEKNKIAEAKMDRWQITSSVAPIYFSSTSNGSPIDAQFAENSKTFENNLSFGVGVNYAINNKISVRTGINKFTLGYNTNDVVFFAAMDQAGFESLASSAAGSTIQVVSMSNSEALRPFSNSVQSTNQGVMSQRMGYFEVPVEMSYKLLDNKFGINVIGGLSTLFLNENEVSVASSTMSANLGKANNLNDIHFSTNIGIGFKYRFWKAFEANFEPMFKYQINTFNKDAGNFRPYFIGLYSGVSFNF